VVAMKRTPFTSKPKRMPQQSPKKRAYRASKAGAEAMRHMGRVKALDCVCCGAQGPSEAHHCRSDGMARDDLKTIPLCYECHRGVTGYHLAKASWHDRHGRDYEFLPLVQRLLGLSD